MCKAGPYALNMNIETLTIKNPESIRIPDKHQRLLQNATKNYKELGPMQLRWLNTDTAW